MSHNLSKVLEKLEWMKEQKIWPNGIPYLWTDAFGVVNLLSLYQTLGEEKYLHEAERVIHQVNSVLGRDKGLRIGARPERDGQYFHYLTKWIYALFQMSKFKPEYHAKAVKLVRDIHPHFFIPGVGVHWKMKEDLSESYPGCGLGGLDFYGGYVTYKLLDPLALSEEIGDMYSLIDRYKENFGCTQDLGNGDMLWYSHFFPQEDWSQLVKQRSLHILDDMWRPEGYFIRDAVYETHRVVAFGNYGVSLGLQAHGLWQDRVDKMNVYFENHIPQEEDEAAAITHVMACTSYYPGLFLKEVPTVSVTTPKRRT